jgi:hypothetical protein
VRWPVVLKECDAIKSPLPPGRTMPVHVAFPRWHAFLHGDNISVGVSTMTNGSCHETGRPAAFASRDPEADTGADVNEGFYEKVIKVKADVAALLTFLVLSGFRHISAETFALGSLRSEDWKLGRATAAALWSVFRVLSSPSASSLPCCIDPVMTGGAVKGAAEGRRSS